MAKKKNIQSQNEPIETIPQVVALAGAEPTAAEAEGIASRLGKGLWGIVGNKTRYSTINQFGGLEYVRYEYRRIPEEFRAEALKNTFLDVIEIASDPVGVEDAIVAEPAEVKFEAQLEDGDPVPTDEFPEG